MLETMSWSERAMVEYVGSFVKECLDTQEYDGTLLMSARDVLTDDMLIIWRITGTDTSVSARLYEGKLVVEQYNTDDETDNETVGAWLIDIFEYLITAKHLKVTNPDILQPYTVISLIEHTLDVMFDHEHPQLQFIHEDSDRSIVLWEASTIIVSLQEDGNYRITVDGYDADQSISEVYWYDEIYWHLIEQ